MKKLFVLIIALFVISNVMSDEWPSTPNGEGIISGLGGSGLVIESITVSPSRPNPGEDVSIKIKIKNDANEYIEDIDLNVELEDVDSKGKTFNLNAGANKLIQLKFNIPKDMSDDETLTIYVTSEGRGKDTNIKYLLEDSSKSVTIRKESHKLEIDSLKISPNKCEGIIVEYTVINMGRNNEEFNLKIENQDTFYTDDSFVSEESLVDRKFVIDQELINGVYSFDITLKYFGEIYTTTAKLNVVNCDIKETAQIQNTQVEVKKQETVEPAVIMTTPIVTSSTNFRDSDTYNLLLIIGCIILLGMIIFIIGALIILKGKK